MRSRKAARGLGCIGQPHKKARRLSLSAGTKGSLSKLFPSLAASAASVALALSASAQPVTKPIGDTRSFDAAALRQVVPPALASTHATADAGIDATNAESLKPAWTCKTDDPVSHSALVDGGDLFFADWGGNAYKLDAKTGEVKWKKHVAEPKKDWPWQGFAGTGVLVGDLYIVASVEGTAYALDKNTGDVKWQAKVCDDPEGGSLATLLAHDGPVYVGLQSVEEPMTKIKEGFEVNFQGGVVALDVATGKQAWKMHTVEPPMTGVAVWSAFALDPDLGLLYFTTGNTYTGDDAAPMGDSIVAVNAKTGDVQWSRQTYEHDVWLPEKPFGPDFDFAAGPQLMDVNINGQPRALVIAGQKSGLLWAFDRATGERVWATSVGYSGIEGGMHGAASIGEGAVFAWSNNGYFHTRPPTESLITVKKLDPATGRPVWVVNQAQPAAEFSAGLLTGGVYFVGSVEGTICGYDAATGKTLVTLHEQPSVTNGLVAANWMLYAPAAKPDIFKWMKSDQPNGKYAYAVGQ